MKKSFVGRCLSVRPQIRHFLRNPTFNYGVFKTSSGARLIQSTLSHPTSLKCILISPFHLRPGLPSGLYPSGSPNNIWRTLKIVMFLITQFSSCDRPRFTRRASTFKQFFPPPAAAVIQTAGQTFWFSVRLPRMRASLTMNRILFPQIVFNKMSTISVL
jgi:hypothetical protein